MVLNVHYIDNPLRVIGKIRSTNMFKLDYTTSEYKGNLLISDTIKTAFEKESITGVWCVRPEEYYRPLSELL